jgi:hypothetical protein
MYVHQLFQRASTPYSGKAAPKRRLLHHGDAKVDWADRQRPQWRLACTARHGALVLDLPWRLSEAALYAVDHRNSWHGGWRLYRRLLRPGRYVKAAKNGTPRIPEWSPTSVLTKP